MKKLNGLNYTGTRPKFVVEWKPRIMIPKSNGTAIYDLNSNLKSQCTEILLYSLLTMLLTRARVQFLNNGKLCQCYQILQP